MPQAEPRPKPTSKSTAKKAAKKTEKKTKRHGAILPPPGLEEFYQEEMTFYVRHNGKFIFCDPDPQVARQRQVSPSSDITVWAFRRLFDLEAHEFTAQFPNGDIPTEVRLVFPSQEE